MHAQACFTILDSMQHIPCTGVGMGYINATISEPAIILNGNITEPAWGAALATSTGGAMPAFGAGHELNALYATASNTKLYLGIAGNVHNNNRILIFIDSKAGGYNNGSFVEVLHLMVCKRANLIVVLHLTIILMPIIALVLALIVRTIIIITTCLR